MALAEVEKINAEGVTENPEPEYHAPDQSAYHVIGEYPENDDTPWIQTQPRWFQRLVSKIRCLDDLEGLSSFGKEAYRLGMSREQAGVFWTEYNSWSLSYGATAEVEEEHFTDAISQLDQQLREMVSRALPSPTNGNGKAAAPPTPPLAGPRPS